MHVAFQKFWEAYQEGKYYPENVWYISQFLIFVEVQQGAAAP